MILNFGQAHMAARNQSAVSYCQVCTECWSNSINSTARLGANMTENASQMELCIILATL